jgi:hypothetical protein
MISSRQLRNGVLLLVAFAGAYGQFATEALADNSVQAPSGQASAWVYVIQGSTGNFGNAMLYIDGRNVGTLTTNTSLAMPVTPGLHEISTAANTRVALSLNAQAGNSYYVKLAISPKGLPQLSMLSDMEGQAALAQSQPLRNRTFSAGTPMLAKEDRATTTAPAPEKTRHSDNTRDRSFYNKSAIAILLKGGGYKIGQEMQTTDGVPTLIEAKSTSATGLEVEWRHPKGFAVGGEIFTFRNKWEDAIGYVGDVYTLTYGVNGKYYFNIVNTVYPYVGAGIGVAVSAFSGTLDLGGGFVDKWESDSAGVAYQALLGVEFRFKYVGINLQYKRLTADVKTTLVDGTTETNEMGGTGQLVGLVLHIPLR